jgi:hypothetical protein
MLLKRLANVVPDTNWCSGAKELEFLLAKD